MTQPELPPDLPADLTALAARIRAMRPEDLRRLQPPDGAPLRRAAVLMLLGPGPDVLLTARSADLRQHAGQVSFPGGAEDPGDLFPAGTALREAAEETGLDPAGVVPLAYLPSLWVPRSSNAVTPVLAWWRDPSPVGVQDPAEVAAVARVPLGTLADPAVRATTTAPGGYRGPAFVLPDLFVWGFTAMLLDALLTLGGWALPWDADRVVRLPAAVSGVRPD